LTRDKEKRMEEKESREDVARKIAKSKVDFLRHLGIYVFVVIVLAIINNVRNTGGPQWWLWPAGIWGAFVVINFFKVFVFKSGALKRYEEQLTKRELDKMGRDD
jgi:hypothetical protein